MKSKLENHMRSNFPPLKLLNRDISILAFNERVLSLAQNAEYPLLERLRYICIVSSNLDEFFEVRAAPHVDAMRDDEHHTDVNVKSYEMIGYTYLKFVVATRQDVEDAERAVEEYRHAGFGGPVYLMPVGGVPQVYNLNTQEVARLALERGWRYSPRLQVDLFKNAWGT